MRRVGFGLIVVVVGRGRIVVMMVGGDDSVVWVGGSEHNHRRASTEPGVEVGGAQSAMTHAGSCRMTHR